MKDFLAVLFTCIVLFSVAWLCEYYPLVGGVLALGLVVLITIVMWSGN